MDEWDLPSIAEVISTASLSAHSWRKSSYSNPSGDCVELTGLAGEQIAVRYSHRPDGPTLIFARAEMVALIRSAKGGEFDSSTG